MVGREPERRAAPLLLIQLVAANIAVAAVVGLVLYFTFDALTEAYFERLMDEFSISPTKLNSMFVEDLEQTLFRGTALALAVGVAVSLLLTNVILRPLKKMARASETIAAGDFSARAPEMAGEIGTLGRSFNAMAATLEKEEARRRQLLRDLSHEIRTPLTNLKGYLEALGDGVFQPEPEVFEVLAAEADRLNKLVDDLSSLAAAEEIDDRLQLVPVDLEAAVRAALAAHEPALVGRQLDVDVRSEGRPAKVQADAGRLHQVLTNAITNMVQYAECHDGRSPAITIDHSVGKHVVLTFENPSKPIPPSDLERLFDRFFRADPSRADPAHGNSHNAGLGLAIVKRLVEAHAGTVRAEQANGRFRLIVALPRET